MFGLARGSGHFRPERFASLGIVKALEPDFARVITDYGVNRGEIERTLDRLPWWVLTLFVRQFLEQTGLSLGLQSMELLLRTRFQRALIQSRPATNVGVISLPDIVLSAANLALGTYHHAVRTTKSMNSATAPPRRAWSIVGRNDHFRQGAQRRDIAEDSKNSGEERCKGLRPGTVFKCS